MRHFISIIILSIVVCSVNAQDPHWSMIQWNPVYLNPANIGSELSKNRIIGIYRNQWRAIPVPYNTTFLSYDGWVIDNHLKGFRLGVGGNFLFDQSGDGVLSQFIPQVGVSFGKYFNYSKQCVAIGMQGGLGIKSLDFNNLKFVNQYNGVTYDPNLISGERLLNESGKIGLFSMGVNFNTTLKGLGDLNIGAAIWNPHTPKYELLSTSSNELPMRVNTYLKTTCMLGIKKMGGLTPGFYYQHQAKSNEYLLQLLGSYAISNLSSFKLSMGVGYRVKDAVIGYLGVDWKNLKLGFSMDGNTSLLKKGTQGSGAYEVLMTYCWERKKKEIVDTLVIADEAPIVEPEKPVEVVKEDTVIQKIEVKTPENKIEEMMVDINKALPVVVFFDNGQPSTSQIGESYTNLYREYKLNEQKYVDIQNRAGSSSFMNEVDEGYTKLSVSLQDILSLMEKGQILELEISGYASPLGSFQSNKLITDNRLTIIENEIKNFSNGALLPYINSGKLTIKKVSYGEVLASKNVSDSINNKESIYSTEAAYERRVEILIIKLK
ncbi:MAG: PorP/SprF family type IX secretion system membrane protein [Chitinophagales bacterium]|nr:PorP/SprF family type IX secretion system membrane protein [Chitinophagales bacterium]